MLSIRIRFLLIAFVLFIACSARAQITNVTNDQATPIPGVGHDYIKMLSETVQPSNGQLSIRIEVPTLPGRSITVPFAYLYNSAGLHHVVPTIDGKALWTSDTGPTQGSGWTTTNPTISATEATASTNYHGPPPYTATCVYFTNYVFQDPTGARHLLPILTAQSNDPNSPNHCGQASGPGNSLLGTDGTYTASTTAPPVDTVPGNPPPVTVVGPDGTVYSCPGLGQVYSGWTTYFYGGCSTGEDRNGNYIISQPTISVTTTSENVAWPNFSFNYVPAPNNPSQANCFGISNSGGQMSVNQSINFPNGLAYNFQYDPVYGLVNRITYPNNGYVKYSWDRNHISEAVQTYDNQGLSCAFEYDTPAITNRYVSFDGVNVALEQDFQYSTTWNSSAVWTSKQTIVVTKDCARNNFNCSGAPSFTTTYSYASAGGLTGQETAVESSVVYGDFNGNTLLTDTKGWAGDELLCELKTLNNGLISGAFYAYANGQITDKKEYDYGLITSTSGCFTGGSGGTPPSGVTPTRETVVNYQSFPPTPIFPASNSIFDRPSSVITYGAGARVAETDYGFDQVAVAPVSPLANLHDESDYGSSYNNRGNATTITTQCFNGPCSGGSPVAKYTFDETGHVIAKLDPCGNATCSDMTGTSHTTAYSYADSYSSCGGAAPSSSTNAYLTKITDPLGHSNSFCYGYNDGQLRSSTDGNSQTTSYTYNSPPSGCSFPDGLDRLSTITYPDGGKTTYCYNDATYNSSTPSPSVITTRAMNSTANAVSLVAMDGLGHIVKGLLTSDPDCASGDRTDTTYDGLGRVLSVSNPYCTTGDPTYGITSYLYDGLGRATQITNPDGSTVLTNYTGPATQVQDEGNGMQRVTRISQTDGLGRLISACEVAPGPFVGAGGASSASLIGSNGTPTSCGLAIPGTGFLTTYQYDPLDNLLQVNQSGIAPRAFAYDSLSRLTSSTNPESGAINYTYDVNGNVLTKIAPAPNQTGSATLTTTYTYDALNRLITKSYSDGETDVPTYYYDVPPNWLGARQNAIGRMTLWTTINCLAIAYDYDSVGRVVARSERQPSNCTAWHPITNTYDLMGNTTSQADGNFHTATYSYNSAGRLITVTDSQSSWPTNLLSGVHYNALGQIVSGTTGYGEIESYGYDNRGRETSSTITLNGHPVYSFSITSFAPNGDVLAANDSSNGNWTYSYDQFNRLTGANQNNGASIYSYVYDRFGNRWQQNGPHTMLLTFSGSNNRVDGYSYDAAGNVIGDGTHTYTYDAENRLIQVDAGNTAVYTYDGEGHRASKDDTGSVNSGWDTPDPSGTTEFVYDPQGHLVHTESPNGGGGWRGEVFAGNRHLATYNGNLVFNHADWLGTARNRDIPNPNAPQYPSNQNITSLPFGDWLDNTQGIVSDWTPLDFTGQYHDFESDLDYFGARYYASTTGRFLSPDEPLMDQEKGNPQSWNLYSYVRNNPLNAVDPDGHDCVYLNNAGNGVESIDHNSNSGECGTTGGFWANGTVENASWVQTVPGHDAVHIFSHYKDLVGETWAGPGYSNGDANANLIPQVQARDQFMLGNWALAAAFNHSPGFPPGEQEEGESIARYPVGRRGRILDMGPEGAEALPPTNSPATIGGRAYSGHALDGMQEAGLTPTVVEEVIAAGTKSPGNSPGTTKSTAQGVNVVTNQSGKVVTVYYGPK